MKQIIPFLIFALGFLFGTYGNSSLINPTMRNIDRRGNVLYVEYNPNPISKFIGISHRNLVLPLGGRTWNDIGCVDAEVFPDYKGHTPFVLS